MANFLKSLSIMMAKRDSGKKILLVLLLVVALLAFASSIAIERQKNLLAAEAQQKSEQVKVLMEKISFARQIVDVPQSPGPEYFNRVGRSYKQLEKAIGTEKIDPVLEKLLLEKPKSDQHVRARVFLLRDAMKNLAATEKGVLNLSASLEPVQVISGGSKKPLLDVNRIRNESPFRKTAEAMANVAVGLQAWSNNVGDVEAVKKLHAALLVLADQKPMLDTMAKDNKFNPVQENIYKTLKKTNIWLKSSEYADLLMQFTTARDKVLDLTKDKEALGAIASSLESSAARGDGELLVDMTRVLATIAILGALVVVVVGDRRRHYSDLDVAADFGSSKSSSLRETQDILPYTQIAVNQVSDLGGKVLKAVKRFHGVLTEASLAGQRERLESLTPINLVESELARMRGEIVSLREQTIQMSLSSSGLQSTGNISDQCIRINAVVDALEVNLNQIDNSIKQAFAYKQGMESSDLQKISRESEGLILVLSQWERQIERMDGVLEEMTEALDKAIRGDEYIGESRQTPSFKLDA